MSLVRTSWAHGQAVQGRYEQGEVFFIAPSLDTLVRNAPTGSTGKQQKKPQPKAGKSKGKGKMHVWQRRMIMSLPQYKVR